MGRKKGPDPFKLAFGIAKGVAKAAAKAAKEAEREQKRREREELRLEKESEREHNRLMKEVAKARREEEKERKRVVKENEKEREKQSKLALKEFNQVTIKEHGLINSYPKDYSAPNVSFKIDDELSYLKSRDFELESLVKEVTKKDLDRIFYSGKFFSVIGIDEIKELRDFIYENRENLEKLGDAIFYSGLYIDDDYIPEGRSKGPEAWKSIVRLHLTLSDSPEFSMESLERSYSSFPKHFEGKTLDDLTNTYIFLKQEIPLLKKEILLLLDENNKIALAS